MQLYMLAPAARLLEEVQFNPSDSVADSEDEDWQVKLDESYDRGLIERIESEGIRNPIVLRPSDKQVMNGHHRIITAHEIDPYYEVPIRWNDCGFGGSGAEGDGWD